MTHTDSNTKKTNAKAEDSASLDITDATIVADMSKKSTGGNKIIMWLKRHKLLTLLAFLWLCLVISVVFAFVFKENNTNNQLSETEQYAKTLNNITSKGISDTASFEEKNDYYYDVLAFSNLSASPKTAMTIYKNEVAGKGYDIDPYSLEWLYEEYMKVQDFFHAKQALLDAVAVIEKNKVNSTGAELQEITAYQQSLQEKIDQIK